MDTIDGTTISNSCAGFLFSKGLVEKEREG